MLRRTLIVGSVLSAAAFIGGAGALHNEVSAPSAAGTWAVDPVHSSMVFRIKHMNTAYFYGQFNELDGTVNLNDEKPEASTMELSLKIDSVETHNPKRNRDIKSPDFFDVAKFPTATFRSTSWKKSSDNSYDVAGDLTIRGVTKPISIKLEKTGAGKGAMGNDIVGFETTFTLNRNDFGMTYMPDGLGNEVKIMIGLEAGAKK
jgi:polyisoprenoid-binding protein YceI